MVHHEQKGSLLVRVRNLFTWRDQQRMGLCARMANPLGVADLTSGLLLIDVRAPIDFVLPTAS